MKKNNKGFTLIELSVVVIIIAILASIGVPQYLKTVETSKATNAAGITYMIASANRMYALDNPTVGLASGQMSNTNVLVTGNYLVPRDWSAAASPYTYSAGATCGAGILACSVRNSGTYANQWGYSFTTTGACTPRNASTPACPVF